MATATPAVSVVMPVYNGERYLREAVTSILTQTWSDFELVVVDDGSTDSTPAILSGFAAIDHRVVIHRQPNGGHTAARNHACRLARASLVVCLDADDVAFPKRLECQRQFLLAHPEVAAVGGGAELINDRGRTFATRRPPTLHEHIGETLQYASPFVHSSVMVRKAAVAAVGGYRAQFGAADDYDLWLRLSERHRLAGIPDLVVRYRIHGSMMSVSRIEDEGLLSLAARLSSCARVGRRPDPLAEVPRIDRQMLRDLGVTERELTEAVVHMTMWLARTLGRAGDELEDTLIARAIALAGGGSGSSALLASVLGQRARRLRERGHPWRARMMSFRAGWLRRRASNVATTDEATLLWPRAHRKS